MEPCKHPRFTVTTEVNIHQDEIEHETDPAKRFIFRGRSLAVQMICAECQSPMKFVAPNLTFSLKGLTIGKDPKKSDSPDDSVLVVPIEPCSSEPVMVNPAAAEKPILHVVPKDDKVGMVSPDLKKNIANWFRKKGIQ